jgi:hypothetical protein
MLFSKYARKQVAEYVWQRAGKCSWKNHHIKLSSLAKRNISAKYYPMVVLKMQM